MGPQLEIFPVRDIRRYKMENSTVVTAKAKKHFCALTQVKICVTKIAEEREKIDRDKKNKKTERRKKMKKTERRKKMKEMLQKMFGIEADTHMSLAEAEYSRALGVENRGERRNSFRKAIAHLTAVIGYLGLLDDVKEISNKIGKLFWNISEDLAQEFWFACHGPMEDHLSKAQTIDLVSTLYGLVERGKDLEEMHTMMVSAFEKVLAAGLGKDGHWLYSKNTLGTDGKPDIELLRSFNKRIASWIKETESAISKVVESCFINPNGIDLKTAYENLIRERVMANQKDTNGITRVEVEVDLGKDSYTYMVYRGKVGWGSSGSVSTYWKNLLNSERVNKALSLSSAEVSDEFANLTGQYNVMERLS